MVKKIISGGQTGADQGGLVAARHLGIETGGWMPKGFKTECGEAAELGLAYGMSEHHSRLYPPRTAANARLSDATAWFGNIGSPGYRCTKKACATYDRPFKVIHNAQELRDFVERFDVKILNVAGNRESKNKGIHQFTATTITEAFK